MHTRQLGAYLRVVVGVLAEVEAGVVDNVTLLHDVRTLRHVASSRILADGLETDIVVWVGCGGKALEHALLSKEQGTDVDGEDGTLFAGILLLKLDILGEETERLRLVLEDLKDPLTTRDNDDVEVLELVVGILELISVQVLDSDE
jgi:hypothetical protein